MIAISFILFLAISFALFFFPNPGNKSGFKIQSLQLIQEPGDLQAGNKTKAKAYSFFSNVNKFLENIPCAGSIRHMVYSGDN
jgi:hypothetical protein